ncbi:MAG: ABC transporter permease [Actinomycetota bacterium]|nr:ABC transporter permease [Actinomycetota bacterium]MDA8279354.1 ABC transporter permease [Actinomycetota bacterium]
MIKADELAGGGGGPTEGTRWRSGTTGRRRPTGGAGLQFLEKSALFVVWILVVIVFSLLKPGTYPTLSNASTILGSQSTLLFLALGLMVPLTVGEYDLSVAYNLVFSSLVLARLNAESHVNIIVSIIVALVVSSLIGVLNAVLIIYVGIDSFVATLGTGTFFGGMALWVSSSNVIGGVSNTLVNPIVVDKLFSIPLQFYYGIAFTFILWGLYRFTSLGQRLLFVGRNRDVAKLSGIRVNNVRFWSLVVSGLFAGMAAVVSAGNSGAADPTANVSMLLPAFAAVFLGATTITPGRFNPWGTTASVYFLVSGITGLELQGAGTFVQDLFYGGALVFAVALSIVARRRRVRGAARAAEVAATAGS